MEFDNTNRGVAYKNDHRTADKHPHWKGKINVGGKDYELAIWEKIGRQGTRNEGQTYLSFSVKPAQVQPSTNYAYKKPATIPDNW